MADAIRAATQKAENSSHDDGGHKAIQPVHQPAMSGNDVAGILDAKPAFDGGFKEIAKLRGDRKARGQEQQRYRFSDVECGKSRRDRKACDKAADCARPGLFRAHLRPEFRTADQPAGKVSADIGGPHHEQHQHQRGESGNRITPHHAGSDQGRERVADSKHGPAAPIAGKDCGDSDAQRYNSGNTGNYREALAIVAADPTLDINAVMTGIQHTNLKYGFYANLEQQIAKDVGLFARASWNDGQNQILSFTDIDRSLSGGLSVKGSYWGRPNDTIGIGGAINALSAANRDFLAAGGLGLLIGDGQLNYRPERVLETYYAYSLNKNVTLTADYQLITNPAYNADRGPVSIFSGRLHGEF